MEAELLAQDLEIGRLRRRGRRARRTRRPARSSRTLSRSRCSRRSALQWTRLSGPGARVGGHAADRTPLAGGHPSLRHRSRPRPRAGTVGSVRGLRHRRDEVRRLVGRRPGQDQARRATPRRSEGARPAGRRDRLGDGQDHRRADRPRPPGLADPECARVRHAALDRRADRVRARRDGDPRPRPGGALADRLAGGDPHRRRPHEGQDSRDQGRSRQGCSRRGQDRARRRLPGLLARHDGRHDARTRRH